jgi:hypothetical protein
MSETPRSEGRGHEVLNQVGGDRRDFIRKIIAAPYVLPVVTSFTLTALTARPALAGESNLS